MSRRFAVAAARYVIVVADERESPTSPQGRRVVAWVWIPAIVVIAIVIWLVVRALS